MRATVTDSLQERIEKLREEYGQPSGDESEEKLRVEALAIIDELIATYQAEERDGLRAPRTVANLEKTINELQREIERLKSKIHDYERASGLRADDLREFDHKLTFAGCGCGFLGEHMR